MYFTAVGFISNPKEVENPQFEKYDPESIRSGPLSSSSIAFLMEL